MALGGGYVSKILYVETKESGPLGDVRRASPLNPPMQYATNTPSNNTPSNNTPSNNTPSNNLIPSWIFHVAAHDIWKFCQN